METRANNVLVGAFVLVGFALALALVVWISRTSDGEPRRQYYVVFAGSVQGLSVGAAVLFNGLRVGDVTEIRINPGNTSEIRARISVNELTPVKRNSRARLTYQGLTGVAAIEISGGTEDAGTLVAGPDGVPPAMFAERSFVQNILEGGQDTLQRVNTVVQRVDDVVRENQQSVNNAIRNIESFSQALAANNDQVRTLLADASQAARQVAEISRRLETIVAAVDPDRVRETVDSVATITTTIAEQRGEITRVVEDTGRAARGLAETAERLAPTVARAEEIFAAIDPATVRSAVQGIDRSAANFARISAAVDEARVRSAVDSIAAFSETLAAERERVASVIQDTGRAARGLAETTERLAPTVARAEEIFAAIDPATVRSAVQGIDRSAANFARISAAVDEARVRAAVDSIAAFSETLAAERERVAGVVQDVGRAARNVADASANLDPTIRRIGEIVTAVDPAAVQRSIENVDRFAASVGRESDRFTRIASDAGEIVASLRRSATAIENFTTSASRDGDNGIFGEITRTAQAIRVTAENLDRRITQVSGGLTRFTDSGLRDLQSLVSDGRRTLNNLDRVFRDLERNPQQFIFGRPSVPTYRR
jgi:phospholipid/cholesterol/gamma-HCH transport system substrate-binding protein